MTETNEDAQTRTKNAMSLTVPPQNRNDWGFRLVPGQNGYDVSVQLPPSLQDRIAIAENGEWPIAGATVQRFLDLLQLANSLGQLQHLKSSDAPQVRISHPGIGQAELDREKAVAALSAGVVRAISELFGVSAMVASEVVKHYTQPMQVFLN